MQHADEHVDGRFASEIVVLVHAGPFLRPTPEFELDEADVAGDLQAKRFHPGPHKIVEREEHVRFVAANPRREVTLIRTGGLDGQETRDVVSLGQRLFADL